MPRTLRSLLVVALVLGLGAAIPDAGASAVLDPTYGDAGVASGLFDDGRAPLGAHLGAADGAGRLVTVDPGTSANRERAYRLTRFDAEGRPDTTFGDQGDVVLPADYHVFRVLAQAGQGIVTWGFQAFDEEPDLQRIMRFLDDGSPDVRFGDDGSLLVAPPMDVEPLAFGVHGELIVNEWNAGWEGPRLARYLGSGEPDPSFGDGGVAEPRSSGWTSRVAVDGGNRPLLVDSSLCGTASCVRVIRSTAFGLADDSFGTAGTVELPMPPIREVGVAVDGEDVLVAASAEDGALRAWRLDGMGRVEQTWEVAGAGMGRSFQVSALGGRAVIAGQGSGTEVRVALLDSDGTLDHRFGVDGVLALEANLLLSAELTTEGVVIGTTDGNGYTTVGRYRPADDAPDPTVVGVVPRQGGLSVSWVHDAPAATDVVAYMVIAMQGDAVASAGYATADQRNLSLTGLAEGVSYAVSVVPFTRTGIGPAGPGATGSPSSSAASRPSYPVTRLAAVRDGDRIRVTWAPPASDRGAPVFAYTVAAFDGSGALVAWRHVGPDLRAAILTGVGGHDLVWAQVIPWTANGLGQTTLAAAEDEGTFAGGPTVPWVAAWRTPQSGLVTWGAGVEHGEAIVGYDVILLEDGIFRSWSQTDDGQRQLHLPTLRPGSDAQVYVFARTATQLGPLGDPIAVVTPG